MTLEKAKILMLNMRDWGYKFFLKNKKETDRVYKRNREISDEKALKFIKRCEKAHRKAYEKYHGLTNLNARSMPKNKLTDRLKTESEITGFVDFG